MSKEILAMKSHHRPRLSVPLLAAVVMSLGVLAIGPASARPRTGPPVTEVREQIDVTAVVHSFAPNSSGHGYATLAWMKDGISKMEIHPSLATGYGDITFYNLHETSAHHWYAWLHYHNGNVGAVNGKAAPKGAIVNPKGPEYGLCWPWSSGGITGQGCWNNIFSWNWGKIIPVYNPGNVGLTQKRQRDCASGVLTYGNYVVVGRFGLSFIIATHNPIHVSPSGLLVAAVSGCVVNILTHW